MFNFNKLFQVIMLVLTLKDLLSNNLKEVMLLLILKLILLKNVNTSKLKLLSLVTQVKSEMVTLQFSIVTLLTLPVNLTSLNKKLIEEMVKLWKKTLNSLRLLTVL